MHRLRNMCEKEEICKPYTFVHCLEGFLAKSNSKKLKIAAVTDGPFTVGKGLITAVNRSILCD